MAEKTKQRLEFQKRFIFDQAFVMTTKESILTILRNQKPELLKYGVSDVGLFGSYLRNEQSAKSDIDLLVDFEPGKENFDNYMAVYDIFEALFKNESIVFFND